MQLRAWSVFCGLALFLHNLGYLNTAWTGTRRADVFVIERVEPRATRVIHTVMRTTSEKSWLYTPQLSVYLHCKCDYLERHPFRRSWPLVWGLYTSLRGFTDPRDKSQVSNTMRVLRVKAVLPGDNYHKHYPNGGGRVGSHMWQS